MIHVLLNDELLAEWQVRYAGANRAIAAGQVAYVSFAHLNTRRVLAGDSDCVGVDVDSPGMPADCGSLDEDRARSAAGVKESPAGFPGESDDDHRASLALLRALPFTYLHVFPFSVRPDAPAAKLAGQVGPEVIRARARELRELGEANAAAYRARRLGQRADGVVTGRIKAQLEVMTEDYLSVYLDSELWDGRPRFEVTVN